LPTMAENRLNIDRAPNKYARGRRPPQFMKARS
jgi:hypothetical protein